jgi:hypothetical protein
MTSMTTIHELRGAAATEEVRQLIALERATIARARHLHGLTRAALERTLADYGGRPADTEVVGRGLADRAGPDRAARPSPDATPEVLFVGRLERRKGVPVLLDAARRLAAGGVAFSLVLAGPDGDDTETGEPYRRAFEREAAALAARVTFAGAVSDAELDDLYRRADLVCVPSRYESHGVVLVEAMMFGKPIVACAAGGVPEVVEENGNALLAEPGDAGSLATELRRLIEDDELRSRFGSRSRALYEERFDADAVSAAMERFLGRVSDAHARAGTAPADLGDRLAGVVREVLPLDPAAAAAIAGELLSPPEAAWLAATVTAERERTAWQERAHEAERQLGEWRARAVEAERQREAAPASRSGPRPWRIAPRLVRRALRRLAACRRGRR